MIEVALPNIYEQVNIGPPSKSNKETHEAARPTRLPSLRVAARYNMMKVIDYSVHHIIIVTEGLITKIKVRLHIRKKHRALEPRHCRSTKARNYSHY